MPDIVDAATRSRMMSRIKSKDTGIEMIIRRGLHARGLRYVLHDATLPGKPDLVFRKFGVAVFVHGCFWHGHDCHLFRMPEKEFWRQKIEANRARDSLAREKLRQRGYRCLEIWECALRGKNRKNPDDVLTAAANWVRNGKRGLAEIRGE